MKSLILLCSFCFLMGFNHAQQTPLNRLNSVGFLFNYPITEEKLPESISNGYAPILLQGNFRFPLIKNNGKNQLTFLVHPQFNPVKKIEGYNDFLYEFGVNFGFAYEYYIPEKAILYAGAGVGPHFINVVTSQQANGFIFSDNFFLGVHQIMSNRKWFMTYEVRFRHISNAGLQNPNAGIDNFFLGTGISKFMDGSLKSKRKFGKL